MKFSVQTEDLNLFKGALESTCDRVRFGPEFCEWRIPNSSVLKEAYAFAENVGKDFTYVTPRVSESNIEKVREQLDLLNKQGKTRVVCNDFGTLYMLSHYSNLIPHLGRQLMHVPARCPWTESDVKDVLLSPKQTLWRSGILKRSREMYSQTSLHYLPTIQFFRSLGTRGVDLDWIPQCFPYLDFLEKEGLELCVHVQIVPVTITRKCHTARFFGEGTPGACSKRCRTRAFLLKRDELRLFLIGNAVFSQINPSEKDVKSLLRHNIAEVVISMNSVTGILSRERIDQFIEDLRSMGHSG